MGNVELEELFLKSIERERQGIELEKIGGKESAKFYKEAKVSYDTLKSALLSGYPIEEIKDAYIKYYSSNEIKSFVTFDEFMSIAIATRNYTLKIEEF